MSKTRPVKSYRDPVELPAASDPLLREPAHRRMVLGAGRGLKVAAVFYAVTLIGFVITLGHLFDGRRFGVVDVGVMYAIWGFVGGALCGLAIPIARSALSSITVAILTFLPLGIAAFSMVQGWHIVMGALPIVIAGATLMGLFWGPLAWRHLHKDAKGGRGRT